MEGIHAFGIRTGLEDGFRSRLLEMVSEQSEDLAVFVYIRDVVFARCSPSQALEIAGLEGVVAWRESDLTIARVVRSVDTQCMRAIAEETTLAPNGIRNAVPIGDLIENRPIYPVLEVSGGRPQWSGIPARVLPTRHCYVGALNVSLENRTREHPGLFDPVSVALSAAARYFPVTLAAGNVDGDPDRTIFGWPMNPDVVVVGAVDPSGTRLLEVSRIGHDLDTAGPDVVANGVDESGKMATSYAAPVVATQFALLAAALMAARAAALSNTMFAEGVPLAARCFVDWDRATADVGGHAFEVTDFRPRRRVLPALPREVVSETSSAILATQPTAVRSRPGSARLRRALLASARKVDGYGEHEVGAGVVSGETTRDYLAGLTIRDLGELYTDRRLDSTTKVFEEPLLDEFLAAAEESMIGWSSGVTDFDDFGGSMFVEPAQGTGSSGPVNFSQH
jgi:hypothetical protein